MFTNESTENLLDNLENELTEVIALDNPTKILTTVEIETEKMPPIPTKRNFASFEDLSERHSLPVPAARRLQSLDKRGKNDENEIIQLSSMSSSSASESRRNNSPITVVKVNERKGSNKVAVILEGEKVPSEETFFVVKHRGKWEEAEKSARDDKKAETEIKVLSPKIKNVQPKLEIVSETPKKVPSKKSTSSSCTSASKTSVDSSSEASSSSEESIKVKKKSKKRSKDKNKKNSKKKVSSDEQATSTETSIKEDQTKLESNQAIGKMNFNLKVFRKLEILTFQEFFSTQLER
jgi:hypothetical protein